MKDFIVSVDLTYAITLHVEAENEEQASRIANDMISKGTYCHMHKSHSYIGHKIIHVDEAI